MNLLKRLIKRFDKHKDVQVEKKAIFDESEKAVPQVYLDRGHGIPKETANLTSAESIFILAEIAKYNKNKDISAAFQEEFGIPISEKSIKVYRTSPRWRATIDKYRTLFLSNVAEVAGSHKRVRMERCENIYQVLEAERDFKTALKYIEHMRVEMEGAKSEVHLHGTFNQLNIMSDADLELRRQDILNKLKDEEENVKSTEEGLRGVEVNGPRGQTGRP